LKQCQQLKVPVVLLNGRMTEPAAKRYGRVKLISRTMMHRLATICVQDEIYAQRFVDLGAAKDRIRITGTMKFDTAQVSDRVKGDEELARELGLSNAGSEKLLVCGSTGPGEEAIVLDVFRELLKQFPTLRLAIIPRHPQRFDEVAQQIQIAGFELLRRSTKQLPQPNTSPIILGDTMGELRKFYSLGTIVFSGRSLVDLGPRQHGSDMIEPAALAKPVIVGPYTNNFAEAVNRLKAANAIAIVDDQAGLQRTLQQWLTDDHVAKELGQRAQQVVRDNQGATRKHVDVILAQLAACGFADQHS